MSKILYFSADWCGPCKTLSPVMETSGLPYTKINVDQNPETASQYNVRNIPTLIKVDENGKVLDKIVGVVPLSTIKNRFNL